MDKREWYLDNRLLTGNEAERYLKHKSKMFIDLRDETIKTLEGVLEYLKEAEIDNTQDYSSYRKNVWNLGESLSVAQTYLELILDNLEEEL